MNEALKQSTEPQELKDLAKKKILGIIGDLNQRKRKVEEAKLRKHTLQGAQSTNQTVDSATNHHGSARMNGVTDGKDNRHFQHMPM